MNPEMPTPEPTPSVQFESFVFSVLEAMLISEREHRADLANLLAVEMLPPVQLRWPEKIHSAQTEALRVALEVLLTEKFAQTDAEVSALAQHALSAPKSASTDLTFEIGAAPTAIRRTVERDENGRITALVDEAFPTPRVPAQTKETPTDDHT